MKHAEDRGARFGYVASGFCKPFTQKIEMEVLEEAKISLEYSKKTIIEMHKFVIQFLEIGK